MPRFTARLSCTLIVALLLPACSPKDDAETDTDATTDEVDSETQPTDPGDDTGTDPGSDTGTDPGSDTDAPVAGCECAADQPCSVSLCPVVAWPDTEQEPEPGDPTVEEFEVSLPCALEALRDGKAGRINWNYSTFKGQYYEVGTIELFGDGTARLTYGGSLDICFYEVDQVTTGPLKPAQHFIDCMAEPDLEARFACVREPAASPSVTCVEGEQNCDGV